MPRNKYPEETIDHILKVSYELFMEKGYEQTTIQDITDRLGMSKGAIYHHFTSKDDIIDALINKSYEKDNWFSGIDFSSCKNGLEKIQKLMLVCFTDETKKLEESKTISLLNNPRFFVKFYDITLNATSKCVCDMIEEGNKDGSLSVKFPKEASQILTIIANFWINPTLNPLKDADDLKNRIKVYVMILEQLGIDIFDEALLNAVNTYFDLF